MKNLLILLIASLSISCNNVTHQDSKIINDDFITDIFNTLDYSRISNAKASISYELESNPQYENKTDSVVKVKFANNTISYYKAFGNVMLTDALIKSPDLKFDENQIYIGKQKQYFLTRFNVKTIGNKLIISDTEERISCTFIFKDDLLFEIMYSALIE